jgi:DNA-binding transcriptional regulator YhcF (GntR family)
MAAGWAVIRWAKQVPPVRRADSKPDATAHHVLLVLATYADKNGIARPSVSTIASECYITDETARKALQRLEYAGLVAETGSWNGTSIWTLNLSIKHDPHADVERESRRERARQKTADRVRRYRERQRAATASDTVIRNAAADRHVTADQTVTAKAGNGAGDRHVTVPQAMSNGAEHRDVTAPNPLQQQVRGGVTASELPRTAKRTPNARTRANVGDDPPTLLAAADIGPASNAGRDAAGFDEFWAAYPRKDGKAAARKAWAGAAKKKPPRELIAEARRWSGLWSAAHYQKRFIPHASTWLNGERWEDESPPVRLRAVSGDYRPWTNPTDSSVYDEDL